MPARWSWEYDRLGHLLLPATLARTAASARSPGWSPLRRDPARATFAWLARTRAVAAHLCLRALAFGDSVGFLVAWSYWISIWVTTAALATAFVSYLSRSCRRSRLPRRSRPDGARRAVAADAVNLRGVRDAGTMQVTTCVLKVVPLSRCC